MDRAGRIRRLHGGRQHAGGIDDRAAILAGATGWGRPEDIEITTIDGVRTETQLGSDDDVLAAYRTHFGIELTRLPGQEAAVRAARA